MGGIAHISGDIGDLDLDADVGPEHRGGLGSAAHEMAEVLRKAGYETEIEYDEHGGHDHEDDEEVDHEHDPIWEVAVSVEMVPTAAELARLQRELQELVAPFGGEANGWGTVGNLEDEGDEGHDED